MTDSDDPGTLRCPIWIILEHANGHVQGRKLVLHMVDLAGILWNVLVRQELVASGHVCETYAG